MDFWFLISKLIGKTKKEHYSRLFNFPVLLCVTEKLLINFILWLNQHKSLRSIGDVKNLLVYQIKMSLIKIKLNNYSNVLQNGFNKKIIQILRS